MPKVQLTDIIEPSVFTEYTIERSTELSRLVQSGIMTVNEEFDRRANGEGTTVNMPFWNDLTGSSQELADDASLTTKKITAQQDTAAVHRRGDAWSANDLAGDIAGDDPMRAVANRVANYWNRDMQKTVLLNSLTGIFATALSGTHVNDISIADGDNAAESNLIGQDAVIDTAGLLGDHWDMIVAMAMHSVPFQRLQKFNLIEFMPLSEQNITVPTFLGREVIVDDGMPTASGGTSGTLYTTYLFGNGAVGMGNGRFGDGKDTETDRDTLAGDDILVNRRKFIMHPRGVAWTGSPAGATPTTGELSTGGNWAKRWEDKNIPILKLVTNG